MPRRLRDLESTLHAEVPLTRQMGIRVEAHDGRELQVRADFAPNINIHGTAFGGSLFSICAVTCWGLLHLKLGEAGVAARAVLGRAAIDYRRPVTGEILCRCRLPDDDAFATFIDQAARAARARITLQAQVVVDAHTAVEFEGRYAAYYPESQYPATKSTG